MRYREYSSAEDLLAAYKAVQDRFFPKQKQATLRPRRNPEPAVVKPVAKPPMVVPDAGDVSALRRDVEAAREALAGLTGTTEAELRAGESDYLARRGSLLRRAKDLGVELDMPDIACPASRLSKRSTLEPLRRAVTGVTGLTMADIQGQARTKAIVKARYIYLFLLRHFTTKSLPAMGREVGGRDHTSVLHGICRIETMLIEGLATPPQDGTPEAWARALWNGELRNRSGTTRRQRDESSHV